MFRFLVFSVYVTQCMQAISYVGIRALIPWMDVMGDNGTVYVLLGCLSDFCQMMEVRGFKVRKVSFYQTASRSIIEGPFPDSN